LSFRWVGGRLFFVSWGNGQSSPLFSLQIFHVTHCGWRWTEGRLLGWHFCLAHGGRQDICEWDKWVDGIAGHACTCTRPALLFTLLVRVGFNMDGGRMGGTIGMAFYGEWSR
jgi:hypothetical protein